MISRMVYMVSKIVILVAETDKYSVDGPQVK